MIGPDLDQLLPQPDVTLGLFQTGLDLVTQDLDLGPLALGPLERRQGLAPRARIAGLAAGPVAQRIRLAKHLGEPRGVLLPLLEQVVRAQPAHGCQRQQRGRKPDLEPPGAALDAGALVGLGGGVGGLLGAGCLGGLGDLRGAQAVLHPAEIGRDPLGHGAGMARAVLRLARQAVCGDRDQLGVGPAGIQTGDGVGQVAQRRLAEDLAGGSSQESRGAGEDLAEDRSQGEDVGALVDLVPFAAGLLRCHVCRRTHRRAGPGEAGGVGAAPRRGDDGLLAIGLAGLLVVHDAAAGQDLGQAPVHHLHLAEGADHDVGRLEVAVDHAAGVGVGHGLGDGLEDRQEPGAVVVGLLAVLQQLGKRVPLDQLHGEEGPEVGEGAQLVDRHDARMLELAADLGLLDEPAHHGGVVAEVVAESLQRLADGRGPGRGL